MTSFTLYQGDCLEILPTLEPGSVDAVITDPPYNVGIDYSIHDDNMTNTAYRDWCSVWLRECLRVARFVVLTPGVTNNAMWQSFTPKWTCIWVKLNQCSPSGLGGWNVWEPIVTFGKNHKPVGHDVLIMPIQTNQKDVGNHPCPKDRRVWRRIVDIFTDEECTILDPFMGSGTTGVACMRTGRNFIGIELDPDYFRIAEQRIRNAAGEIVITDRERATGQLSLFGSNGQ